MAKLNTKNLFLICAAIMIVIRTLFFLRELLPAPFNYVGIVLIVVGLIMAFGVVRQFDKLGTEIHTFKTPKISDLWTVQV